MAVLSELRPHLGATSDFFYASQRRTGKEKLKHMNCPYCAISTTRKRTKKTELGYVTFFCPTCQRTFNERTNTPFNHLAFPTDVVLLVVLWRLRYKLSLRDVAEMFLERGFVCTHETVRDWQARFAPLMADQLRRKRRSHAGNSWYVDETYIKVHRKWCYLYRAIDHNGNLVDSRLSEKRDMDAAQQFFKQAVAVVGHTPETVTTDGHRSYPRAIRETMGVDVVHRTNVYLNNRIEQNHRGIKQRYYPMRGFGSFTSAARFCHAFDELQNYFRYSSTKGSKASLVQQRKLFCERLVALQELIVATSSF
jgi:putative transposase